MAILLNILFTFLVLIVGCISLNVVSGNLFAVYEVNSNDVGFDDFREPILTAEQTALKSNYSGCKRGHCWKTCDGIDLGNWCFTTETYVDSYDFVPCTNDADCDSSLECGGPCRIGSKLKQVLHQLKRLKHIKHLRNWN